MDNIINRIIEIDNKAAQIKANIKIMSEENEKILNSKLKMIEEKELSRAKEIGQKEYEKLVREGKHEARVIMDKADIECTKLEEVFRKTHKALEKEILKVIFRDNYGN